MSAYLQVDNKVIVISGARGVYDDAVISPKKEDCSMVLHWQDGTVETRDFDEEEKTLADLLSSRGELKVTIVNGEFNLENVEKNTILSALELTGWVQQAAAKLLGISPRSLNYKITQHKITHKRWVVNV